MILTHNLKFSFTDLKNFDKYNQLYEQVKELLPETGLSTLINNAGISTNFHRLKLVKVEQLLENFTTNTVGPIMLTKVR